MVTLKLPLAFVELDTAVIGAHLFPMMVLSVLDCSWVVSVLVVGERVGHFETRSTPKAISAEMLLGSLLSEMYMPCNRLA